MRKINWNGKEIELVEDAIMCGNEAVAKAVDADGNKYWVHWDVLADFVYHDDNDFSEACDWDNPDDVVEA